VYLTEDGNFRTLFSRLHVTDAGDIALAVTVDKLAWYVRITFTKRANGIPFNNAA